MNTTKVFTQAIELKYNMLYEVHDGEILWFIIARCGEVIKPTVLTLDDYDCFRSMCADDSLKRKNGVYAHSNWIELEFDLCYTAKTTPNNNHDEGDNVDDIIVNSMQLGSMSWHRILDADSSLSNLIRAICEQHFMDHGESNE